MSIQIIIQSIKLFGNILSPTNNHKLTTITASNKHSNKQIQQQSHQQKMFRATLGTTTFTSTNTGFFLSQTQLVFDQPFSLYYDNKSLHMFIEIFSQHQQQFNNNDLQTMLQAEFDLSDYTTIIGDCIQTTLLNINDKAVGTLTLLIDVFKQGPRFIEKVSSNILFQTVKQEKQRQKAASQASKNIKQLMVSNSLTNTLMTINYMQIKPYANNKQQQSQNTTSETQIFNKQCFILIRYGSTTTRAYTKVTRVQSKQSIPFTDYIQFMLNDDVKFQFFFMYIDQLNNIICKAKGEIRYIVFDQTINNHTITMFDKRSVPYSDLLVKFIQKQVDVVNIFNKIDKKLKQSQQLINIAIDNFNRFKFESKNNNRILSEKLRQLQMRQLKQQQQKMKPVDAQQKKKRQQHSRFIQFLQKEVIKIERDLKRKEIEEKKGERKEKYHSTVGGHGVEKSKNVTVTKDHKLNSSMGSTYFKQQLNPSLLQVLEDQPLKQ